ncbi:MAG: hypothetical protein AAF941_02915 [Pseudomonadota bacterium]
MSMEQHTDKQMVLPRSGKRPLAFHGELLVEGSSATEDDRIQYDLAVFELENSGFAASLACSYEPDVEQPRYYADTFEDVDQAIRFFADYCPADDVPLNPDASFAELANVDTEVEQATSSYKGLLRQMFPTATAEAIDRENATCPA